MARDTVKGKGSSPSPEKPAWFEGIVWGYLAGLVGAIIFAAVIVYTDATLREAGFLTILIGAMAGFALARLGRVSGTVAGIVGAVIALVCWVLSLEIAEAWTLREETGESFMVAFGDVMPRSFDLLKGYFQADAMGYLFMCLAGLSGFVAARGFRWKK